MRGWFVTGTDTGVGKTFVACALVRALRERGVDVGVMKPCETGVDERGPLDAQALREAAGVDDPLDDVCPQRFALPAAPSAAARYESSAVDLSAIRAAFQRLKRRHAHQVVEGAGGLRVPLAEGFDMGHLAADLDLPLLVVARAALGTVNHTLLTLEAARTRSLPVAGVVISHADGVTSLADLENLAELRSALGATLVGEVAWRGDGSGIDVDALLGVVDQDGRPAPPDPSR